MSNLTPPRAFISHASEDKDRFVLPFAARLRSFGIDAWVDEWEIGPGDSLVQRIFDEGIARADAFVVVLSNVSVGKPWVREELDAGVVRRITSDRSTRLIPIVLDADVDVPTALRHLLWESVPRDGIEGVTAHIVDSLLGRTKKPPLGPRPTYESTPLLRTKEPADETVFNLIVELIRSHDAPGATLWSNSVQERAQEAGVDGDRFRESMHALTEQGLINAQVMAGGLRWRIKPFSDRVWLELEKDAGKDLQASRVQLLALIVNDGCTRFDAQQQGIGWFTMGALLRELQAQKLVKVHMFTDGTYGISNVSPLARRALRDNS